MDSYEIQWKRAAQRDLRNIDPQQVPKIINGMDQKGNYKAFPPELIEK